MGFGKDGRGVIINELRSQVIGTLAALTGLFIGTKIAITEDFRMLRAEVLATITNGTAGEFTGMELWLVDGDLTLGEFEQKIEINGPTSRHDRVLSEQAERFAKPVGYARQNAVSEVDFVSVDTNAKLLVVKPRWTFGETTSWNWVLYNRGVPPTTGATIQIQVTDYGLWLD